MLIQRLTYLKIISDCDDVQNLKLENKATNQPPVFIGTSLMHQHKDWKTYSIFANSLNFRFATFLRCFIHFTGNIKTELKNRNISSTQQKLYMQEIFGKQEGTTKFYGLVDSESTQEFDQKLEGLKNDWNNRESGITNISFFFDWFKQEKVG